MPTPRIHHPDTNQIIYFLTLTTIEWLDIFTKPQYYQVLINSLKFCQKEKGLLLHAFVIMTNHVHLLAQAKEGYELDKIIQDFKRHTTKEIKSLLQNDRRRYILRLIQQSFSKKNGQAFQIWQRENYPELIESEDFLEQKFNYIHDNPVRKGYVVKPEDWQYSSARNYLLGDDGLVVIDKLW